MCTYDDTNVSKNSKRSEIDSMQESKGLSMRSLISSWEEDDVRGVAQKYHKHSAVSSRGGENLLPPRLCED